MPDNKVVLNYDGKSFEYPIVESTIGDRGIDISKLRDQTGLITLDLGYKNTGVIDEGIIKWIEMGLPVVAGKDKVKSVID